MAFGIKCDRCGEFESSGKIPDDDGGGYMVNGDESRHFSMAFRFGKELDDAENMEFDLCEDCRRELADWVREYE